MADKNIKLVTYAGSTVTPQDDALVHETAIPKSGIIYGAKTTKKANNMLHIAAGHGIICGRKFTISECDVSVQLTGGASHKGRVYVHMDLSNSTDPIQILIETGAQLTNEIQQQDVNILNGVYEFNLATFMVDATTVFNVVDVFPTVSGKDISEMEKMFVKKDDILKTMEEVNANKSEDKVAGAEALKELSNDLDGCKLDVQEDGVYIIYTTPGGADTVRKKLGSAEAKNNIFNSATETSAIETYQFDADYSAAFAISASAGIMGKGSGGNITYEGQGTLEQLYRKQTVKGTDCSQTYVVAYISNPKKGDVLKFGTTAQIRANSVFAF